MTRTAPALTDRDALLAAARAAGLFTPAQEQKAQAATGTGPAAAAAAALVAAGLLTRFQADRLLNGRTDGFQIGQYVILDQIGRGSMSRVYKARHRTMNRAVAVKVLAADLTRTAAARNAFQDAVRAIGRLSHPNIVTAFDANELYDRFYLVLEYVDGPSLEELVRRRGPVPVGEACEIVRQVAHGLAHAHGHGMIHRDLRPASVLVGRCAAAGDPVVKISNFGVPRAAPGETEYVAPEALQNPRWADPRGDLYALGAIFHFLLAGRPPGGVPLAQARPDAPPAVVALVADLLAPAPARIASAAELLARFDRAGRPVALAPGAVDFDAAPVPQGYESGYLTGRHAHPGGSGAFDALPECGGYAVPFAAEPSPWEQITNPAADDTAPLELDDRTPAPPPHRVLRLKPHPGAEPVPLWMTAALLVCIVLLSLVGIGAAVKLLAR